MNLKEIIKKIDIIGSVGDIDRTVSSVVFNSLKAQPGSLFIAVPGFKKDGKSYIRDAAEKGAVAFVSNEKTDKIPGITQLIVKEPRIALAQISDLFYGRPSRKLKITGITGTNGKTTTTFLIDSMLKAAGLKTSFITTVKSEIIDTPVKFDRTTPESLELNDFFSASFKRGVSHITMEVSSHAIDLHRIDYMRFETFVFTNLTQDHLDYHKNMENYFFTKKKIFLEEYRKIFNCKNAVINIDDHYGKILYKLTDLNKISYSVKKKEADIFAQNIVCDTNGIKMDILLKKQGSVLEILSPLSGYFNVYNILGATGAALALGIKPRHIEEGIRLAGSINGRFEKIKKVTDFTVVVDYAHTPDGLKNVLKTAKSLLKENNRLIVVFGCGGDRDKRKRPKMGSIAGKIADLVFITSDNPRTENPETILSMIEKGVQETENKNYFKIPDRKKAIIEALQSAGKGDIVIIAGKGHEDYQEFSDYRIHFSDQEIVKEWAGRTTGNK